MAKKITRAEARALGLPRYYTGRPCPNGHVAERRTNKGDCVACRRGDEPDIPPLGDGKPKVDRREKYTYVTVVGKHVSLDEVLAEADIDMDAFEVVDFEYKPYEMGMKGPDDEPTILRMTSWRIKLRPLAESALVLAPRRVTVTMPAGFSKRPEGPEVRRHTVAFLWPDTHLPYHDPAAVNVALQIMNEVRPNWFVNLGDLLDCESISKYAKNYLPGTKMATLQEEIDMGAKLCALHAEMVSGPTARRYFLEGNHEDRLIRQVHEMAASRVSGEILGLDQIRPLFNWERLLGLGTGWHTVPYREHVVLQDSFLVLHGEALGAQPERKEYERYEMSGASGHTHRIGVYHKRSKLHGTRSWHGVGFLGLVRGDYTTFPNWQQGFGIVHWGHDNRPFVEQVHIHEGRAWFRGRQYVGDSTLFGEVAR